MERPRRLVGYQKPRQPILLGARLTWLLHATEPEGEADSEETTKAASGAGTGSSSPRLLVRRRCR